MTRFLVRYLWRPLELSGCNDPTSAAKNYQRKEKTEQRLAQWAGKHETLLVAGHTHRASFSKPGEGYYFNDGSCVHPHGITALELECGAISLVKWSMKVREDNLVYIGRAKIFGRICKERVVCQKHPCCHAQTIYCYCKSFCTSIYGKERVQRTFLTPNQIKKLKKIKKDATFWQVKLSNKV